MADLYTKDGRPLRRSGDNLYARSGTHVGRVKGSKVYGPDGQYVGTIAGDRLVYRSTDSASISSPFAPSPRVGSADASRVGAAIWGDKPPIRD